MGGASADRDFLFTGKERIKSHNTRIAIEFSKRKVMFLFSVIARELLSLSKSCFYQLGSARKGYRVDNFLGRSFITPPGGRVLLTIERWQDQRKSSF